MPPRMLKRPFSGNSSVAGMPASEERDERQADDQAERDEADRRLLAGLLLPLARPAAEGDRADDADDEARQRRTRMPGWKIGVRREEAAIVEEDAARKRPAVAQVRQRLEHGVVPEQQLQQQRQVADQLDVAGGELARSASSATAARCR